VAKAMIASASRADAPLTSAAHDVFEHAPRDPVRLGLDDLGAVLIKWSGEMSDKPL